MKNSGTIAFLLLVTPALVPAAEDRAATEAEARRLVTAFAGELKPMLQHYMQTRGPVGAIEGCAVDAPEIADRLSEQSGWSVGRVSLRPRNSDRGTPDTWESNTLEKLQAERLEGAGASELNHGEWVGGRYRYMQAQIVEGICLNCHGEAIAPAVRTSISRHYPEDRATGYSIGEIRGAITLTAPTPD